MRIRINVYVEPEYGRDMNVQGTMSLSEEFSFDGISFLEIASVLGQFHDLAQQVKDKQEENQKKDNDQSV